MVKDFAQVHDAPVQTCNSVGSEGRKIPFLALSLLSALPPVMLALATGLLFAGCMTVDVLVGMMVASAVTAFSLSLFGRLFSFVRENITLIVPSLLAVCCVLIVVIPSSRNGLFAFCNAVIDRFDDVFSFYVSLLPSGGMVSASLLFGVLFGVLVGILCWSLSRQPNPAFSLLVIVLFCGLSLLLSLGYSLSGIVMNLCAWLLLCRFIQLRTSSYSALSLLFDVACFFLGCLVSVALLAWAYSPAKVVDDVRDAIIGGVGELCYGHDSLPEGDMSKAPLMNVATDDERGISVSLDQVPSDDLLLKGFVGAQFDGVAWSSLSHESYEGEWRGLFPWLSKQGLVPSEQRAAYDKERAQEGKGNTGSLSLSVDASEANRRYVYAPYTMSGLSGATAQLDLDGSVLGGPLGAHTYRIEMDDVPTSSVQDDTSWLSESNSSYAQAESVYSAFAKEGYLDVDDENKKAIDKLIFSSKGWDKDAASSKQAVVSRVRTMLETLATYTETPSSYNSDASFVEWFLSDARSGNSAYFATAATLAFRSQGIPARYVEGYRASTYQMSGAVSVGQKMFLEPSEAHAWVEIYLDGQGWTPVEVTPGFYVQNSKADKVVDVNKAVSRGADNSLTDSGSVMGDVGNNEEQPSAAPSVAQVLGGVVAFTLLAVLVFVLLALLQRRVRILVRRRYVASDDQAISVPVLYRYLTRIMNESGCGFDPLRPLDCIDEVPSVFAGVASDEYLRVIELHEAFAFGERELKPHEMRAVRSFTQRLHGLLPKPDSVWHRIRRYFVNAL